VATPFGPEKGPFGSRHVPSNGCVEKVRVASAVIIR
jgi:hypothetical protein